jgi:hypothetical protein
MRHHADTESDQSRWLMVPRRAVNWVLGVDQEAMPMPVWLAGDRGVIAGTMNVFGLDYQSVRWKAYWSIRPHRQKDRKKIPNCVDGDGSEKTKVLLLTDGSGPSEWRVRSEGGYGEGVFAFPN